MARVFGVHTLELHPNVSVGDWERYLREDFRPIEAPGLRGYITRADRGPQQGSYLLIVEFDDAATRDRYFPTPGGEASAELRQTLQEAETANAPYVLRTWLGDFVTLAHSAGA